MNLWLVIVFLFIIDSIFVISYYNYEIKQERIIKTFPKWMNTKIPIIYFVLLSILFYSNILIYAVLYPYYKDVPELLLLVFYFSLIYLFAIATLKSIILALLKSILNKTIDGSELPESTKNFDNNEIVINNIANCIFPNGKRNLVYFKANHNKICLYYKYLYSNIIGKLFYFFTRRRIDGKKLSEIKLQDIVSIEKARFRLSKNAFNFKMKNGDNYLFLFENRQEVYTKLLNLLPNTKFINIK